MVCTNVTTYRTDPNCCYTFTDNKALNGTYYFRAIFGGDALYTASTSSNVTITVVSLFNVTALTISISTPTTGTNQNFTINGALVTGTGSPVASKTVTLQTSTDDITWNAITPTATTDPNGVYIFTEWEGTSGTYYFQTTFAGDANYGSSTSTSPVSILITSAPPAQSVLSISMPSLGQVDQDFTITGTLSSGATGIGGVTITLQRSTDATNWGPVAKNPTATTDVNGNYTFTDEEVATGTYYYRTTFAGTV